MLVEALKFLADMAMDAVKPLKIDSGPREDLYLVNGQTVIVQKSITAREHAPATLADVIALANRFAGDGDHKPAVWYDEGTIEVVIDDEGHRSDNARMTLEESDVFRVIRALRGKVWMDQKKFIRLLRLDLAGTLEPGILLERVKKLKYDSSSSTTSHVNRTQESLGREVLQKVEAPGGEIPEIVMLSVPVYRNAGERAAYPLRCAVEIDAPMSEFLLLPLPDEIERVQQLAMSSIEDRLSHGLSEGIPFYYGKP